MSELLFSRLLIESPNQLQILFVATLLYLQPSLALGLLVSWLVLQLLLEKREQRKERKLLLEKGLLENELPEKLRGERKSLIELLNIGVIKELLSRRRAERKSHS